MDDILDIIIDRENAVEAVAMVRVLRLWWAGFRQNNDVSLEEAVNSGKLIYKKRFRRLQQNLARFGFGDVRFGLYRLSRKMSYDDNKDLEVITQLLHGR